MPLQSDIFCKKVNLLIGKQKKYASGIGLLFPKIRAASFRINA
jgi:hypothetical protein